MLDVSRWLGVKPSYSGLRVGETNAVAKRLCRTATYRPEFATAAFENLDAARCWALALVLWHNFDHRHSGTDGRGHWRVFMAARGGPLSESRRPPKSLPCYVTIFPG